MADTLFWYLYGGQNKSMLGLIAFEMEFTKRSMGLVIVRPNF